MTRYYTETARLGPPRRLSAGRRGHRPVRGRARSGSPPGWARPSRRRSSPPTRPRRSTSSPTPGAARTSAAGDLVVLTEMEHHSNIVPWQMLCAERGAELAYVPVLDDGQLDLDALDALLARAPKLVGRRPHLQRARHDQPGRARSSRRAHEAGAVVVDRRRPGGAADARSTCARSTPTSTPGPATRPTARPASACCTAAASCSRRCRRSWAAAT